MPKRLILILAVVVALVLGAEAFLPKFLSDAVAQGLSAATSSREMSVKLEKTPAIFMLAGKFDHIDADAAEAKIDKVIVHAMHLSMDSVELDSGRLFSERKVVVKKAGEIKLSAVITQEALANYLNTSVKGVHDATVAITPEKTVIGSRWMIGGLAKIDAKLEGKIISDQKKIKFIPDKFMINSSSVKTSSLFGGTLLSEIAVLDSGKLPFGVVVRDIAMQNGQIVINADNKIP